MNLAAIIRGELPVSKNARTVASVAAVAVAKSKAAGMNSIEENGSERFCDGYLAKTATDPGLLAPQDQSATAIPATPATDESDDEKAGSRRAKVLQMLADPAIRVAIVVDDPDADPVEVAVGIRHIATAVLEIPKNFYNPETLLELLERHSLDAEELG